MKTKKLLVILGIVAFVVSTAGTMTNTGKSGKADSPSEGNCSSCHNNTTVNTGGGSVVITSNIPGWVYTPGQTYQITVTVSEATRLCFGLCFESLNRATNVNAGTLVITNSTETHLLTAGNGRTCVTHQLGGGNVTVAGSKAFNFNWTAPATDIGIVRFYVGSIAGIADNDETDDNCYTSKQDVNSPATVGISEAALNTHLTIFPNPVIDMLNISIYNSDLGRVKGELYSMTGQKVSDLFEEEMAGSVIEKHIPVSDSWAKGIYFVRITQGDKSTVNKIVIQ